MNEEPLRELEPERLGDHIDRLYRAAVGMCGSHADAEDLVQETYVHVLRKPRFLRSDDDLGYLMRVLRNTFNSRYRTEVRRPGPSSSRNMTSCRSGARPEHPQAAAEQSEVLAAVSALPEPYREAVAAVDLGRAELPGGRPGAAHA